MEALGEQPQARPKCPNARKSEIAIIPSCDPTYAPVIQSLCVIAEAFFCEAELTDGFLQNQWPTPANRLQCWALHFYAPAGCFVGAAGGFRARLLDK
jgi:hypothetical protein